MFKDMVNEMTSNTTFVGMLIVMAFAALSLETAWLAADVADFFGLSVVNTVCCALSTLYLYISVDWAIREMLNHN